MEKKKTDPLSTSLAKLSGSSRGIPYDKDFHFYINFDEFKHPIKQIADNTQSMLDTIARSSSQLWDKNVVLPPEDNQEAYDWLVNVNDEVFERFDFSVDELQKLRKGEEENGFQKKGRDGTENSSLSKVKVAYKDKKSMGPKPKVPFHIPTIRRPQDEYKILVDNSNQPFEHVGLQKSEDGSRFIHHLENCSVFDFVDKSVGDIEPVKPPPVECTPYKLVEQVKDLKELAAKLRDIDEFAVDLEHNQYRSFQGLTCLMQISTRADDFIVDTLKLRSHIGLYLREVFKDPTKKKVIHGADRDIIWLQKDFGIYVCNLFDTGQASRVLKLERFSLEYLLHHFCGIAANKEYQNADWRLRPLTKEMLRYAREDTHYLLYIYDQMRIRLLSSSSESENSETSLVEVYQRSYDICMQLYEKELLTDSSYLQIYGVQGADFNAQQLAVVAGLYEWRDGVARAEDESTGYILPNKILLEIAKQMPLTTSNLRRVVKSKNQYIDRNLGAVVNIIRHSVQNAAAYEATAKLLKERIQTRLKEKGLLLENSSKDIGRNQCSGSPEHPGNDGNLPDEKDDYVPELQVESFTVSEQNRETNMNFLYPASGAETTVQVLKRPNRAFGALLGNSAVKRKFDNGRREKEEVKLEQIKSSVNLPFHSFRGKVDKSQPVVEGPAKTMEILHNEEPAKPLEILHNKESSKPLEILNEEPAKALEISCSEDPAKPQDNLPNEEPAKPMGILPNEETVAVLATNSPQDIILLDDDSDEEAVNDDLVYDDDPVDDDLVYDDDSANDDPLNEDPVNDDPNFIILSDDDSDEEPVNDDQKPADNMLEQNEGNTPACLENDEGDETMSLPDLSSSFKKCLQATNQTGQAKQVGKSQESGGLPKLRAFNFAAAIRFGEDRRTKMG